MLEPEKLPDNFSDQPVSLGEVRSDRAGDGAKWTPREALIRVLRMIDSGEISPDTLVVAYAEVVDGNRKGHFWQSTSDGLMSLGLMQSTICKMQE